MQRGGVGVERGVEEEASRLITVAFQSCHSEAWELRLTCVIVDGDTRMILCLRWRSTERA